MQPALWPPSALADHDEVLSNSSSYHKVSGPANLTANVRDDIYTEAGGRTKRWKVWLDLTAESGGHWAYPDHGKEKSYA